MKTGLVVGRGGAAGQPGGIAWRIVPKPLLTVTAHRRVPAVRPSSRPTAFRRERPTQLELVPQTEQLARLAPPRPRLVREPADCEPAVALGPRTAAVEGAAVHATALPPATIAAQPASWLRTVEQRGGGAIASQASHRGSNRRSLFWRTMRRRHGHRRGRPFGPGAVLLMAICRGNLSPTSSHRANVG